MRKQRVRPWGVRWIIPSDIQSSIGECVHHVFAVCFEAWIGSRRPGPSQEIMMFEDQLHVITTMCPGITPSVTGMMDAVFGDAWHDIEACMPISYV